MEKLIYSSPKKYRILEIKKLLSDNNIPVTSIQLYIYVNMSRLHARGEDEIIDIRERRGELNVPIEEFNEELNDAETLEIYTEEKYADEAMDLIEKYNEENLYKNCIYKSMDYNEASGIQELLLKKNIPCDDIITNVLDNNDEEYIIYLDPDFLEKAEYIIENKDKPELLNEKQELQIKPIEKRRSIFYIKDDLFSTEKAGNNIITKFLKVLIIAAFFFIILYIVAVLNQA
jgi:shikimate kinase